MLETTQKYNIIVCFFNIFIFMLTLYRISIRKANILRIILFPYVPNFFAQRCRFTKANKLTPFLHSDFCVCEPIVISLFLCKVKAERVQVVKRLWCKFFTRPTFYVRYFSFPFHYLFKNICFSCIRVNDGVV